MKQVFLSRTGEEIYDLNPADIPQLQKRISEQNVQPEATTDTGEDTLDAMLDNYIEGQEEPDETAQVASLSSDEDDSLDLDDLAPISDLDAGEASVESDIANQQGEETHGSYRHHGICPF